MSVLVVEVLHQGIVFGADRNITILTKYRETGGTFVFGQTQRPKVLRWPNRRAIIGYVGTATVGELPTDEWLYEFIGENLEFQSFAQLAEILRRKVEKQRAIDEGDGEPEPLVIHLGGFEAREGIRVPVIWFVTNAYGLNEGFYCDVRKQFKATEEFWNYFPTSTPLTIRTELEQRAANLQPFWFHQGLDLMTFNAIEAHLKAAFRSLCQRVPHRYSHPKTLGDWEKFVKMYVLTYGAFFQAFRGPGEYYVGGGADTVSLPWPEKTAG